MSPLKGNGKVLQNKDLPNTKPPLDRKTDSKNPKTTQNQAKIDTQNLPADLAEIVAVWPELPEHIKAAIKALIQTYEAEKK